MFNMWCFIRSCCDSQSKGGILSKACDYIRELRQNNQRLQESYKEVERVELDNEMLRQQVSVLGPGNLDFFFPHWQENVR